MDIDFIYQTYFKDVFLYLRSLSASEDIAEEITQETFVKALKAIDTFDGSKDIRAWLFTIAKNTLFTYYKREKIFVGEEVSHEIADPKSVFTDRIVDEESAFLIHQYLHKMNEPYKEVFMLSVFGGFSLKDISSIFWEKRKLGTSYILPCQAKTIRKNEVIIWNVML